VSIVLPSALPAGHSQGLLSSFSGFLATSRFESTDWILIVVIVVLLVASAGLALAETSLVRVSRVKALSLLEEKRRGAKQLARLTEHPEGFLNPVLLLVLICQLVTATFIGILADRWFGTLGVLAAIVFEVVVIFVFAEALPKNWAVQNLERSALSAAPVVSAVIRFPPIRFVSSGLIGLANLLGPGAKRRTEVSESELLAMADVALEEEVIETDERRLIHSIIEFGDTIVREVMVPRPDMCTVEAQRTVSETLGISMSAGYSRLPVYSENIDDVLGIAYTKDLVHAEREGKSDKHVSDFARTAHFVPETKRVSQLMREMQELKYHMAIVVDEYGGTAGLVTLEDLIEELVGEIVDEYDVEEPPVEELGGGALSVSARLDVDELGELTRAELPDGDWDTVGGLLYNLLGRVPNEGESVEAGGLRLEAQKVQGNRIGRVKVVQLPPTGEHDGETPSGERTSQDVHARRD
jgi:magnesium and cobalt exporter, CNNM family